MIRRLRITLVATCMLVTGMAGAQDISTKPFGEGWKRIVPIPSALLGEGDTYVVWVEEGWLQVRRQTEKGLTDWHIVLARTTGPEAPVIEAETRSVRFALSYRNGRYFVREDMDMLACLRERKSGSWPSVPFSAERYKLHGSASTPKYPPMLRGFLSEEEGLVVASSAGPTELRYDCVVRLSPKANEKVFGYTAMTSPQRRVSWGKNWLADDGELLVAQRTLEAMIELEVGDPAPSLAATTFGDAPFDLANYRGKYVLLDFWATWCGPCLDEIPNLKETYKAFSEDGRLVMIGLCLDREVGAPKKLVASREIPWVQLFLGDLHTSSVYRAYRIHGIPAIFLIGPDGRIVAKDLRGEKINETVAKALGKN